MYFKALSGKQAMQAWVTLFPTTLHRFLNSRLHSFVRYIKDKLFDHFPQNLKLENKAYCPLIAYQSLSSPFFKVMYV